MTFLVQARLEVAVAVGSEVVVVVIEAVAVGIEEASAEVVAVDSVEVEVGDFYLNLALYCDQNSVIKLLVSNVVNVLVL